MKKSVGSILIAVILAVGIFNIAIVHRADAATPTWDQYCSSCHGSASSFGPRTVAQINAALTSVSQMKNISLTSAQIQTISNELSGNTADTTPPTVTAFTIPSPSTSLTVSITTLTATDNVGVTGYMVTSTATKPAASSANWSATPPASFTFPASTTSGAKTLYAWAKDAAGNVSLSLTAPVTINLPGPDKTKPTVTAFVIPAASNSLTVPITTFTVTDNVGVTGYMVTSTTAAPAASSANWSATPPASFTFPATTKSAVKTLYAWAKDAAGNVSLSLKSQVTLNTKPIVTAFVIPAASNSLTVPITAFTATDDVGVTAYMVTSTATAPAASSTKWSATPPASFTFPATTKSGAKTVYAWAKDAGGNVSLCLTAPVTLNLPGPDKTKPTVTAFVIPAASNSLTVPITTLTATDNVGVTGYMVTSTATAPGPLSTKWSATPPASFTFPATTKSGAKTVYAWAKDAAKNVSPSLSAQVTITLPVAPVAQNPTSQAPAPSVAVPAVPQTAQNPTSPAAAPSATAVTVPQTTQNPTSQAPAPGATAPTVPQMTTPHSISDMQIWVGRWFKINVQNKGFYTAQSGLSTDRQSIPGYLKIWAWDPNNKVFQGDLYQYDSQLNQWVTDPLVLHYISGGDLDFMVSSQVVGDLTYGFTARIQGTEANGVLVEATFRTLGGYHMQWDAQQGKHWAGWLVVTGRMVSESEVQIPADKIQH